MKKHTFTLLKFLVGFGFLTLLFIKIGFRPLFDALREAHIGYFFIAFLLFIISFFIAAFNVFLMIKPFHKTHFFTFLHYFFVSNRIASLFFPGRVGEYSLTLLLKKFYSIPIGVSAAAITMDKVITLGISAVIGIIGLLFFFERSIALRAIIILSLLGIVVLLFLLPQSRRFIRINILGKYASILSGFYTTFSSYWQEHRVVLLLNFCLTLLRVIIIAFSAFFMFGAVGVFPSLLFIISIGGIETISTILPITSNGLGIKQSLGIYLYYLAGVDPAVTAARYVLGFIINYGFALLSLLFVKNPMGNHETSD